MNPTPKKTSTLEFVLTFVVLFLAMNYALNFFFPKNAAEEPLITLSMEAKNIREGNDPVVIVKNRTDQDLALPPRCPQPPLNIARIDVVSGKEAASDLMANDAALPCTDLLSVPKHDSVKINLASWKYALLETPGTYEASLEIPEGFLAGSGSAVASVRFEMTEPGVFTKLFRTFVTRPLYNLLVFIASWVPGHNLGVAIVLLTILIKFLLLVPNQHALEGQRKLQELQPRMEEIKKKYPGDPTKVQEETMRLWKEMKINPLQSCLPTLLQLPILIGLFFVIRSGISVETSKHLLYSFYQDLPSGFFGYTFLGFDLLKPSIYVFPPLLVLLQFFQMKMMMKKRKKQEIVAKPVGKSSWIPELDQQTMMTYLMPLMIGFFALRFPAAVSLYWGVSTLFAIAQQWFVMHEKLPATNPVK